MPFPREVEIKCTNVSSLDTEEEGINKYGVFCVLSTICHLCISSHLIVTEIQSTGKEKSCEGD